MVYGVFDTPHVHALRTAQSMDPATFQHFLSCTKAQPGCPAAPRATSHDPTSPRSIIRPSQSDTVPT